MTRAERIGAAMAWAADQLRSCSLCPRQCRVDRRSGEVGWCGAGASPRCFLEFVNFSEEPELTPSHAVCLTGCNLGCVFCHTIDRHRDPEAPLLRAADLAAIIRHGRQEGARNLNLYGGEPLVSLPGLLSVLAAVPDLPFLVWNTNLYCEADTLAALNGIPDLLLVDLKFGNNGCAAALADAAGYWDILRARLTEAVAGALSPILVRHLVLPGHVHCCTRPGLEWLAAEVPALRVSLHTDYLVMPAARAYARLGRFLRPSEAAQARQLAADLAIDLVDNAAPPCRAGAGRQRRRPSARSVEAEIVLAPTGQLFLRNAPREVAALVHEVAGSTAQREVTP